MEVEINLLPKPLQKVRRHGIYFRRLDRLLWRLGAALGVVVAGEVAILMYFLSLAGGVNSNSGVADGTGEALRAQVLAINQLAGEAKADLDSQVVWSGKVQDILAGAANVSLTEIATVDSSEVIEMRGRAEQRAAVVALQTRLEQLKWIKEVEVPLQNFTVGPGAEFSLRLQLAEEL